MLVKLWHSDGVYAGLPKAHGTMGMNVGRTAFAQLIAHLSHIEFQKCVTRYDGDQHRRRFSCWDQYLAMAFAQVTYRASLRDIEAALDRHCQSTRQEVAMLDVRIS